MASTEDPVEVQQQLEAVLHFLDACGQSLERLRALDDERRALEGELERCAADPPEPGVWQRVQAWWTPVAPAGEETSVAAVDALLARLREIELERVGLLQQIAQRPELERRSEAAIARKHEALLARSPQDPALGEIDAAGSALTATRQHLQQVSN